MVDTYCVSNIKQQDGSYLLRIVMMGNRSEAQRLYPQIWTTCSCTPFSSQVRDKYEFSLFGARKGILRRYTLIALALFLCLNTVKIIADYHAGEIRPVAANTSGMQAGYDTIYERIKGPITEETVSFITSEYQRLDGLTADGTYSREPQEGTYSGYIFGDYYLLHSYFYPHMEYSVKYSSDMEEILAQAKENMTFYRESGNTAGAAENAYILHHYAGRTIPAFYLYDGWEALLSYDFSDLLILLLLILAVAPAFTREKENGMTLILPPANEADGLCLFPNAALE